jgi:hypothetical protein
MAHRPVYLGKTFAARGLQQSRTSSHSRQRQPNSLERRKRHSPTVSGAACVGGRAAFCGCGGESARLGVLNISFVARYRLRKEGGDIRRELKWKWRWTYGSAAVVVA